jgi:hypothetical protein
MLFDTEHNEKIAYNNISIMAVLPDSVFTVAVTFRNV